MSRKMNPAQLVVKVPGIYEHVVTHLIAQETKHLVDPRATFMSDDPAVRQRLNNTSTGVRQAKRRLAELQAAYAASGSIVAQCRSLRCREFPEAADVPWLADPWSEVREVRITADDHVQPAQVHRNGRPADR